MTLCSKRIWDSFGGRQCSKKATITRNGKDYCRIHDPDYIAKRNKERQEKEEAAWKEKNKRWDAQKRKSEAGDMAIELARFIMDNRGVGRSTINDFVTDCIDKAQAVIDKLGEK